MHGVLREAQERNVTPTADDFQAGLDGNLCRCTGYRPIIDACKVRNMPCTGCWQSACHTLAQSDPHGI